MIDYVKQANMGIRPWYQRVRYEPWQRFCEWGDDFASLQRHPHLVGFLRQTEEYWAEGKSTFWGQESAVGSEMFLYQYPPPLNPMEEQACRGQF